MNFISFAFIFAMVNFDVDAMSCRYPVYSFEEELSLSEDDLMVAELETPTITPMRHTSEKSPNTSKHTKKKNKKDVKTNTLRKEVLIEQHKKLYKELSDGLPKVGKKRQSSSESDGRKDRRHSERRKESRPQDAPDYKSTDPLGLLGDGDEDGDWSRGE